MIYASLYNFSQKFVKNYKCEISKDDFDAIIIEFINTYLIDIPYSEFMIVDDLYSNTGFCTIEPSRTDTLRETLNIVKDNLLSLPVKDAINMHSAYNNCSSLCNVSNEEAKKVIEDFIDFYMKG